MNTYQEIWWQQSRSDLSVLLLLRREKAAPCHQLHYLQMVSEKISKAYFWNSATPPPKQHTGFVQFLRRLGTSPSASQERIAQAFGFSRFADFTNWIRSALPLAYQLEQIAPTLAQNGPNPEYPWPHESPRHCPANFEFPIWRSLMQTGQGRQLVQVIQCGVESFPAYA